jgi:hypothetical protein
MGLDVGRVASSAVEAFLHGDEQGRDAAPRRSEHRLGARSALLLGAAAGAAGHIAYRRARKLSLAQVAGTIERRLRT